MTGSTCSTSESECVSYESDGDDFSYDITGLSPYTNYVIDMRAVTCGGAGDSRGSEETTMESSMSLTYFLSVY